MKLTLKMTEQAAVGSPFSLTAKEEEHAERLLVSRLLRAEVRLLGMELKRKGLNQVLEIAGSRKQKP